MNRRLIIAGAAFILALFSCQKKQESVTLAGSTAFQPFAEKLAEEFMAGRKGVNVTVQGGGSAVGINAANSGAANIGMADLVVLPAEAKDLTAVIVARDGIVVVVNPSNSAANLSMAQIRDVFTGKIASWKELGGFDKAITVVSREAGSGTRSSFEKIVGGISLTKNAIIQDSNGTIRETVANDANAIGYLSHGLINDKIKALTVDGKTASIEAMISGAYPLVRPIYFLTKGAPSGAIKEFIDYVLSETGQKSIKADGLIPAK
jgi:phosphate transport system substrate-binding protein